MYIYPRFCIKMEYKKQSYVIYLQVHHLDETKVSASNSLDIISYILDVQSSDTCMYIGCSE